MNYNLKKRELTNLFLDMNNPWNRITRRALVMGGLTALSVFLVSAAELAPEFYPIIMFFLSGVDKALREHKN